MALIGHSGSHRVQSMHSSGSITRKLGPSWKQSTGHTSTQSVYLHLMQFSVTTKGMVGGFRGIGVDRKGIVAIRSMATKRRKPAHRCAGFRCLALPTRFELVF